MRQEEKQSIRKFVILEDKEKMSTVTKHSPCDNCQFNYNDCCSKHRCHECENLVGEKCGCIRKSLNPLHVECEYFKAKEIRHD